MERQEKKRQAKYASKKAIQCLRSLDPVNEKWYLCKSKLERKWKPCCHVAGVVVMIFNNNLFVTM